MDGVRDRKLELVHFLSYYGVDNCLLRETFLKPGEALRFANYVYHRTDRPTAGGGIEMLARRGIVHYSVPVKELAHFEAAVIQVTLTGRHMIVLRLTFRLPTHCSERT